jgi:hypothetical protein
MVWTVFNPTPSSILLVFALYRPAEILVFVLRWIVTEDKTLLDIRRAALGFLINQVEVVLCFAALFLWWRCAELGGPTGALYNSLRTVVTIGPASTLDGCQIPLAAEMVVAYSITVTVIAAVIGELSRGATQGNAGGPANRRS